MGSRQTYISPVYNEFFLLEVANQTSRAPLQVSANFGDVIEKKVSAHFCTMFHSIHFPTKIVLLDSGIFVHNSALVFSYQAKASGCGVVFMPRLVVLILSHFRKSIWILV